MTVRRNQMATVRRSEKAMVGGESMAVGSRFIAKRELIR
jgi:hypothetical protein